MKRQRCSQQFKDLPDDCWERVFRFLSIDEDDDDDDDDNKQDYLKSLSVASKQFLSVTNRHRLSLTILYPTLHHLPRLLQRFTNLILINLSLYYRDLDTLLSQISCFPLNQLRSLNLSNHDTIPVTGLRAFSKKITTLTTLVCSNIGSINATDLKIIADCFPLLEELDLSYPRELVNCSAGVEALSLSLFKLRKVNLTHHYYLDDQLIFQLFKNCKFLEEAITVFCPQLTAGVACALRERPILRSIYFECLSGKRAHVTSHFIDSLLSLKNLTCIHFAGWHISDQLLSSIAMESLPLRRLVLINCTGYTYSGIFYLLSKSRHIQHLHLHVQKADYLNNTCLADLSSLLPELVSVNLGNCHMVTDSALFTLIRNCPLLTEINMKFASFEKNSRDNPNSLIDHVVNPQFKYLSLPGGLGLQNENIIMLAATFPNLQRLNLSYCTLITEQGIGRVLRSCPKIRHLDLTCCLRVKSLGIHFDVPKLEMLNLTGTIVDDEALNVISMRCRGLLQLVLLDCRDITRKGVMQVVKSCTHLREINLISCLKVHASVVASMVLSSPSLRKIATPPGFPLSDKIRKRFLRDGCLLES